MEDWSKLEQFMTQENLLQCGVSEYTTLAQCLGNNILVKYQVSDSVLEYNMTIYIFLLIVMFDSFHSFLQMYKMKIPGLTDPPNIQVHIQLYYDSK